MATTSKNVAIYCRISRADRQDGAVSVEKVEAQEKRCREYAAKQGWTVSEVFTDNDISGGKSERPAFIRLQSAIESKSIDVVLATFLDRITREEILEQLQFWDLVDTAGVEVWTIDRGHYRSDDELAPLMRVFEGFTNSQYRKTVSKKQKARIADSKKQGKVLPARHRLFGYADKLRSDIDPIEAELVAKVFKMVIDGNASTSIAAMLNAKCKTTTGNHWFPRHVAKMIQNPTYKGWSYSVEGELMSTDGQWPVIIEPNIWQAANDKMATRKKYEGKGKPKRVLSGVMRCGNYWLDGDQCLAPMYVQDNNNGIRYRCLSGSGCGSNSVKAEWIENLIINEIVRPSLAKIEHSAPTVDNSAEIKKIDSKLERLKNLYKEDDIDLDEYRRERDALKMTKAALVEQQNPTKTALSTVDEFDNASIDVQRETIKKVLSKGVILLKGPRSGHYNEEALRNRLVMK